MDSDAARIIDLYERHARAFDAERSKNLFERTWLDRFLSLTSPGGKIADLGCGSGEPIARYLIENGKRITGIDASPSMVTMCRSRFPAEIWIVADMRGLTLDGAFDGLLAFDSFFHLPPDDQRAMFSVFASLAKQRAPLLFTSGPKAGVAMGTYHGAPLYHASLDPSEYRSLLDRYGFDEVAFASEDQSCGGRTLWLARRR